VLPRFEVGQGVDQLLSSVERVHLTALPRGVTKQSATYTRDAALKATRRAKFGDEVLLEFDPPTVLPSDAWVRLSLDEHGNVVDLEQGPAAVEIVA
jgi:hypothetical protein